MPAASRHRRGRAFAAALLLSLMLLPGARADTAALRFGGDPAYPPFHYRDGDGGAAGFDVELLQALADRMDRPVQFQFAEWGEIQRRLAADELDVVPMFVSPERARHYRFTEPFLMRYHLVFGRSGSAPVTRLSELRGRRVAVQRAGLADQALDDPALSGVLRVPQQIEADALVAVARGDADYALVPSAIGYQAIARRGLVDIVAVSPPLLERGYAFAVPRDRPDLAAALDDALRQVQSAGVHDHLYRRWLATIGPPAGSHPGPWLWLLGGLLIGLGLYAWWRRRAGTSAGHGEHMLPLPERHLLVERLRARIARQPHAPFALWRIHLIGLDSVDAIAGDQAGDQVRREIALRLRDTLGGSRMAAIGDDTLLLCIEGSDDPATALDECRRIAELLERSVVLAGQPIAVRCRGGVALYPLHAIDVDRLLRAARLAGAAAEREAVHARVYDPSLEPDPRALTLLAELREAIAQGQLGYAVQPKIGLADRCFVGAELLVRWQHPRHGAMSPGSFVPLAEQAGAIGQMSLYLLSRAIEHCRQWRRDGLATSLSVNISANDLCDPALVETILAKSQGVGDMLILELTETDVMRDPTRVVAATARLRAVGIRISIDDFGTGHSSLANLQRLDPDELKIDQSFVTRLRQSRADQAIVRATIKLAHELGATVTAEGIEDELTVAWLAEAGCDAAQGFAIARPMPIAEFVAALREQAQRGERRRGPRAGH